MSRVRTPSDAPTFGVVAQLVERELCKLEVEGSSPFCSTTFGVVAQTGQSAPFASARSQVRPLSTPPNVLGRRRADFHGMRRTWLPLDAATGCDREDARFESWGYDQFIQCRGVPRRSCSGAGCECRTIRLAQAWAGKLGPSL